MRPPSPRLLLLLLLLPRPAAAQTRASVIHIDDIPRPKVELLCDGKDNDGDGLVDEDFDLDGDGLVRCCDNRDYYATETMAEAGVDVWVWEPASVHGFVHHPLVGSTPGEAALNGLGDFDLDGVLELQWRDALNGDQMITSCQIAPGASQGEWSTQNLGPFTYLDGHYPVTGDANRDGCLDLVGVDFENGPVTGTGEVYTALGNCNGTFTELGQTGLAAAALGTWVTTRSMRLEDIDGDGNPDLILGSYDTGLNGPTSVWMLAGDGLGGFAAPAPYHTVPQIQNGGDLGDVDGDGCSDWVGGPDDDGNRGEVHIIRGTCGGPPPSSAPLVDACVGCGSTGLAASVGRSRLYDWDADGDLDLLVSQLMAPGKAHIDFWENTGWISGPAQLSPTPQMAAHPTEDEDFVVPVRPLEICDGIDNDGDGQIDEGFDLDGDGQARCCEVEDVFYAAVEPSGDTIDAWVYDASSNDFHPSYAIAQHSSAVELNAIADFTGDDVLDVLWTDAAGQRFSTSCAPAAGSSGEWITTSLGSWSQTASYHLVGDVDADGCVDLVGWDGGNRPYAGSGQGQVALGDCSGGFQEIPGFQLPLPLVGAEGVDGGYNLTDMDGDGLLDITVWGYSGSGASSTDSWIIPGNGTGWFGSPVSLGTLVGQPQNGGDVGDLDADGCLDVAGGSDDDGNAGASFGISLCSGSSSLLVDGCTSCGSGPAAGLGEARLYDWDQDGQLDLLTSRVRVSNGPNSEIDWWHYNGGFPATPTVTAQTPAQDMGAPRFVTPMIAAPNPAPYLGIDGSGVLYDVSSVTGLALHPRLSPATAPIDIVALGSNLALVAEPAAGGGTDFLQIDPTSGALLSSCWIPQNLVEGDLAMQAQLVAGRYSASPTLIEVDPFSCTIQALPGVPPTTPDLSGLAADGPVLWGLDGTTSQLFEMDPFGQLLATTPLSPGLPVSSTLGLHHDPNSGLLVIATGGSTNPGLWLLDPQTAVTSFVGTLGLAQGLVGITQAP